MALDKFNWQNGSQVEPAKVEIEGVSYDVVDAQYEGETPLSASNLNLMQDTILGNVINNLDDDTKIPSVKAVKDYYSTNTALLSSSTSSAYTHNLTLLDDALKYKELVIIVNYTVDGTNKSITLPIISGTIYSGGTTSSYHWIDINVGSYNSETKQLTLKTAYWTSSGNNAGVGIVQIYGRM